MTSRPADRTGHWVPATLVLATLFISAIRGLGNPAYGPLPALARLESIKFIDPVLVLAIGALAVIDAMARGTRIYPTWKVRWAGATALVLAIGVMSALSAGAPFYYAAQSIWFVLRPAVLLLVLMGVSWDGRLRPWLIRAIVLFTLANAALVIAQWLVVRAAGPEYAADRIIGLFHDAHQQAAFGYTAALLSLAGAAAGSTRWRQLAWLGLAVLNVLVGFVSQGQKATGIAAGVLVLAVAVLVLRSRRRLVRVLVMVPVAVLASLLFLLVSSGAGSLTTARELITGNLEGRLSGGGYRGLAFVRDLGVVRMFEDFGALSAADPATIVLGVGPSNYGSPAAMTRLDRGLASPATRDLFWWEVMKEPELIAIGELRLLGLSAKTSLVGVVLGEYGCIAVLAFLYVLLWPLWIPDQAVHARPAAIAWGSRLFWLKTAYLAVVLQAAVATLGAWDNDVVLTLLLVGFASVMADRERTAAVGARASSS